MSYLTESALTNVIDVPITLPATELRQGDWLILSTVKLVSPMRLTYRYVNLSLLSANVEVSQISNSNRIFGNLGLVYLALRKDYSSGSPGAAGALDVFGVTALGTYTRTPTPVVVITEAGNYSWIITNNLQPSSTSLIPSSTSIDFLVSATGLARLELSTA